MGLRTKYTAVMLGLVLSANVDADQCVLQDKTVSKTAVVIAERSTVRRDIVKTDQGQKCLVDFRVRIGSRWHTAFGEYAWSGNQPASEACAVAADRAENDVRQRVGKHQIINERTLICKDRPQLAEIQQSHPGTVAESGQFRIHPDFPEKFYHNGAQCRWFLEPVFVKSDMKNYQGIICQIGTDSWVVIDKF